VWLTQLAPEIASTVVTSAARLSGKDPAQAAKFAHSVAGRVICGRGALLDMAGFNDLALK